MTNYWKRVGIILIIVVATLIVVNIIYTPDREMVALGEFNIEKQALDNILDQFNVGDSITLFNFEENNGIVVKKVG